MDGGHLISKVLAKQDVKFMFTLCGGHISPILVGAKREGIRVVDVRHEATAVFAADAVSRLSGTPGVAAVTAGPGLTNTITAVKNAYMAQSPLVLFGGATATVLKGKGSLQDIDQMELMKPHVKWATTVKRYKNIVPTVEEAFEISQSGVPGPVFIECPINLLYDESIVRDWYKKGSGRGIGGRLLNFYLQRNADLMFSGDTPTLDDRIAKEYPEHTKIDVDNVAELLSRSERPVMIIGSQAMLDTERASELADAVETCGVPVYLSGMARGLLGPDHPLQVRHKRREALRDSDLTILAGVPCDFRLNYGSHIRSKYVSVNLSKTDLYKNKKPNKAILAEPGRFIRELSHNIKKKRRGTWLHDLHERASLRDEEITRLSAHETDGINQIQLFEELDKSLDNSILIGDGGDFVGTGAYVMQPRGPLTWLDPGVFGTLGVGAGFALGAKLCRPDSEVWIIYGDGSAAYSIAEYDTFVRHNIPIISVVGNDACWSQIAREQVEVLKDDVATVLRHTDYDIVAKGYGGDGRRVETIDEFISAVSAAKESTKNGVPYLINAIIGKSDFRKGSISM